VDHEAPEQTPQGNARPTVSVTLTEVLMAIGSFSIDLDWDPELMAELVDGRGILFYWGEQLIYGGIKLGDNPSRDGITITGVGPEWLLGDDTLGPTLEDKVYVAGNNKLSNPAFVYLGSEETTDIHTGDPTTRVTADSWKLPDPTGWVISSGAATSTSALTDGFDLDPDVTLPGDILTSDEKFETFGGDLWRATVTAQRLSGTIGHLRAHLVYDGHFRHPNLLAPPASWTPFLEDGGDASVSGTSFLFGPIAQPQYVPNPSFESGLSDWVGNTDIDSGSLLAKWDVSGSVAGGVDPILPHSGSEMAIAQISGAASDEKYRFLVPDFDPIPVLEGERYLLEVFVAEAALSNGDATVFLAPFLVAGSTDFVTAGVVRGANWFATGGSSPLANKWKSVRTEYGIPAGVDELSFNLFVSFVPDDLGLYGGTFCFDDATLTRIKGNTAKYTAPAVSVLGEEEYTVKALVTAGAGMTTGDLGFSFLLKGPGRPDQVIDGASIDFSATTSTLLESPFVVPSGYNSVTVSIVAGDVLGGTFTVGTPTMSLSDNKRYVADLGMGPTLALSTSTLNSTAPAGAEHVHLELIAEDKGDGYVVHSVSLARAETPWTSAAVANDLLSDPITGDPLLEAGNIVGPELITFDWHVRNLTRRAQLQHLSRSGIAEPEREWRIYVNPSQLPVMDWGIPEAIFDDRTDLVFRGDGNDLKVITAPVMEHNAETRVTRVKVVGADRQRPDGPPVQITGVATNPNSDFLDWFGQPLNRTETVTESSADHPDYAAGLAAYKASLAALPVENVRLSASDWKAWADLGPLAVGSWVYVYKPDARIEDASNPIVDDGGTIWPKKLRLISRNWHLGNDFRIEIHRPGQDNYVIPDELVHWDPDTTAEFELGDPLPEFEAQSEGDTAYRQLVRFRASMPR
jgi:hypothetical protein